MKAILFGILLLGLSWHATAQTPAESVWTFGERAVVNFSTLSPVTTALPNNGGGPMFEAYQHSGALCDNSGQLLFWAKIMNTNSPAFNVYDRNGQAMPNGALLTSGIGDFIPIIVPAPGSSTKYYLFYIKNHGLLYSVIDMSLNSGLGDVVSTQKNILLGSYGTVLDRKMVSLPGCNGAWIIVRSASQNQYLSYAITNSGIDSVPNLSNVGNLPLAYYGAQNQPSGVLKVSADGRRMAAACGIGNIYVPNSIHGGLEIYEVEPCSGKLLSPVIIDTGMFYGACFSPDGSKLYATKSFEQKVYQYDLSLITPTAITASRTAILSNPNYGNFYPDEYILGELKRARDGKIYVANHVCGGLPNVSAMHVINNPNNAGLACNPMVNAVYLGNVCPGLDLPADIVYGQLEDTVYGARKDTVICFRDSARISATPGNHCYRWVGDTVTERSKMVKSPGSYVALYSDNNCKLHIDTIAVSFTKLRVTAGGSYSCPGKDQGNMWVHPQNGDTTTFTYKWMNGAGSVLRNQISSSGDTLMGADTGTYRIYITTSGGCDTFLTTAVKSYPVPVASFTADTVVCKEVPVRFSYTSTAPAWRWYFDLHDFSTDSFVTKVYRIASSYPMMLVVRSIEGCTDTARKTIVVKELALNLAASKTAVNIGAEVTLYSSAPQLYSVLSWKPLTVFNGGTDFKQHVKVNATSTYTVTGQSREGCIDSAEVTVNVNPIVFIPDAFTPNGDGLNDRFRPRAAGDQIFIRHFEIYNRWGQLVWQGVGKGAVEGWDGSIGGKPADMGTYFFVIDMETTSGGTVARKGDVILVR